MEPVPLSLPRRVGSLLDVGCGVRPQSIVEQTRYVGVDAYRPYLERIQPDYTGYTLINGEWKDVLPGFVDGSFDLVMALDFIEHLTRREGKRFLREAERIGRYVAIFTPYGFLEQTYGLGDLDAWEMGGTRWQTHQSGWTPDDFPGWDIEVLEKFHNSNTTSAFWAVKGDHA